MTNLCLDNECLDNRILSHIPNRINEEAGKKMPSQQLKPFSEPRPKTRPQPCYKASNCSNDIIAKVESHPKRPSKSKQ